jgi:hypothetical protein
MKSLKFALLVASAFFQMAHADDIDAGRVPIGVTRLPEYNEPAPAHEPEVTAAPNSADWNSGSLMQNNSQFNQAPNVTSGSGSYSSGNYQPASASSASAAPSATPRRPASVSNGSSYSVPDFEYSGVSGVGFDASAVNRPAAAQYNSSGHSSAGGNSAYAAQQAALQAQHDQALAAQQQAAQAAAQGTRNQFLRAGRNGGTVEQAAADEAAELARRQAELEARQRAIQATLQNENR